MIASLHCITTRNPGRNKINSHISSIISEKEKPARASDKVETEDIKPKET